MEPLSVSDDEVQSIASFANGEISKFGAEAADNLTGRLERLKQSTYADLLVEWRRVFRAPPPKRIGQDLLVLGIAWKIQEQARGGHSAITKRTLTDLARKVEQDGDVARDRIVSLKPGAKLQREWKGTLHTVTVLEDAFEWAGKSWRSLSVIAREITGTRWSGPRFFGMKGPACSQAHILGESDA